MSSLKKVDSLVPNNRLFNHPIARVLLNFLILSESEGVYVLRFVCVWKKKKPIFFISKRFTFLLCCFCQFCTRNCLLLSSSSDRSRLPFRLMFNNLSKNLKNFPKHLDVLLIWIYICCGRWNLSQIDPIYTQLSHQYPVIWDSREGSWLKNSKFVVGQTHG